ncbi:MAG TPA: hypothetical protein VMV44_01840 [Rectinemataceae bacterium]|nr:hypothetical protein [Rectinemataceae bacterium]
MHGIPTMLARVGLGAAAAALVLSCAGTPSPAPKVPVKKERTVTLNTPVLVKETVFYPDGLVDTYTVFKYDDSLKRLLEKTTFDPARPDPIERVVSEYDTAGVLVDELSYGSNGSLRSKKDLSWTKEGLLASEKGADSKGLGQFASNYGYDKAGRRVLWQAFDGAGILRAATSYAYDGQGRPVLIEIRNAAKALTSSIEIAYAPDGSSETRNYLAADGSVQSIEVSLFKDGRLVHFELRHPDNSLVEATDYSYGPDGQRLTSVLSDPAGKVKERRSFEYAIRQDQKVEIYYE